MIVRMMIKKIVVAIVAANFLFDLKMCTTGMAKLLCSLVSH